MSTERTITIQDAKFLYGTNFSGDRDQFNDRGDRTFNVVLPEDLARDLAGDGWNVRHSKPRKDASQQEIDEFESVPFLPVKVGYKMHPPRVVMIGETSRRRTELGEDTISLLDDADIVYVDLMIRPREWEMNGKEGIRAYLKTMYVTIAENELDLKYAEMD